MTDMPYKLATGLSRAEGADARGLIREGRAEGALVGQAGEAEHDCVARSMAGLEMESGAGSVAGSMVMRTGIGAAAGIEGFGAGV